MPFFPRHADESRHLCGVAENKFTSIGGVPAGGSAYANATARLWVVRAFITISYSLTTPRPARPYPSTGWELCLTVAEEIPCQARYDGGNCRVAETFPSPSAREGVPGSTWRGSGHPAKARDPVYGNAVNLPPRECDDCQCVVAPLFTVCGVMAGIKRPRVPAG